MDLTIFNVEHGACALINCDNGTQIMIDAGHNAATGWRPGDHLRRMGRSHLQQLIITNYDEDHVSGLPNLFSNVDVQWLMRNTSVTARAIRYLKSDTGMGSGIDCLVEQIERRFSGGPAIPLGPVVQPNYGPGFALSVFNNLYPVDFVDENNLSLVVHLVCNGVGVMFTGDIEKAGWEHLVRRPDVQNALTRTDIFIAPHHGRTSGCCDTVFQHCSPSLIVVSDKEHMHDTQLTIDYYGRRARGAWFRQSNRKVVSTRSDGDMLFTFLPGGQWMAC